MADFSYRAYLAMVSCLCTRGPLLERWHHHYALQKEGPLSLGQLSGHHVSGRSRQMFSAHPHHSFNVDH